MPPRLVFPSFRFLLLCGLPGCLDPVMPVGADGETSGSSTTPDTPDTPTTTSSVPTTTTGDAASTSTTSSTGDDADPGSAATGTTMAGSWCGDGIVDADEECDEGLEGLNANDDNRYCTTTCKLNVCGDGKLFVGWELCDEGRANSDEYGSVCGTQCEPADRCGDNKLQPEFETCDLGAGNGGLKGDAQGILCDASCRALQLRGFITNDTFHGDLGGLFGADLKCRAAAKAAGLSEPERFHAFLSTGDVHAKQRFAKVAASWPYVLVTGKKFADSFAALIEAGPLGEGISITEQGNTLYMEYVATNTAPGGGSFSPEQHCQGWTSAKPAHGARAGLNALPADSPDFQAWQVGQWWTGAVVWPCNDTLFRLYCLEI